MRKIMFKTNKTKGFTLIELLVVIAIIGLLASIVLVSVQGPRVQARDTKRMADMRSLQTAMELCYSDSACGAQDAYPVYASYADANTVGLAPYIGAGNLPLDPQDPTQQYEWTSDDNEYCIYAALENADTNFFFVSNAGSGGGDPTPPCTIGLI
ncbi:MAG: type II secretion system protein [Candidatus Spechtbacterales bacterium]